MPLANRFRLAIVLVGTTFMLASCATRDSLREKAPTKEFSSSRAYKDVAGCIYAAWQARGYSMRKTPDFSSENISVIRPAQGIYQEVVEVMVDITPEGTGAKTHYYEGPMSWEVGGDPIKPVESCQQDRPKN